MTVTYFAYIRRIGSTEFLTYVTEANHAEFIAHILPRCRRLRRSQRHDVLGPKPDYYSFPLTTEEFAEKYGKAAA